MGRQGDTIGQKATYVYVRRRLGEARKNYKKLILPKRLSRDTFSVVARVQQFWLTLVRWDDDSACINGYGR